MNDRLRESVSALVDGEAGELELRRLLASDRFDEVRSLWRSYHRLGDHSPGLDARFASIDISGRVMAAIDEVSQERPARWWRPVASVAVAASVAAVVAVGVRSFDGAGSAASPQIASSSAIQMQPASVAAGVANVAATTRVATGTAVRPVALDADELARQQLDRYLLRHTERAALTGNQGIVGFARVTHFDSE
jgi:sigma-E factor negative regulatory protein RseA